MELILTFALVLVFVAPIFAAIILHEAKKIQRSKPGWYSADTEFIGE